MEEIKNCSNCGYYIQHYIIHNSMILKTSCEHCIGFVNKYRTIEGEKYFVDCPQWTSCEDKKAEKRKTIKEVLRNMGESLETIARILETEQSPLE